MPWTGWIGHMKRRISTRNPTSLHSTCDRDHTGVYLVRTIVRIVLVSFRSWEPLPQQHQFAHGGTAPLLLPRHDTIAASPRFLLTPPRFSARKGTKAHRCAISPAKPAGRCGDL